MTLSRRLSVQARRSSLARRVLCTTSALAGWFIEATLPVSAHGAAAAASVIAPPLLIAGALGCGLYWIIVLWPASGREPATTGVRRSFFPLVGGRMMERVDDHNSQSHLRAVRKDSNGPTSHG